MNKRLIDDLVKIRDLANSDLDDEGRVELIMRLDTLIEEVEDKRLNEQDRINSYKK